VLEIGGEKPSCEIRRIPDHKARTRIGPSDDVVGGRIVYHFVSFYEKRRRASASSALSSFHGSSAPLSFRFCLSLANSSLARIERGERERVEVGGEGENREGGGGSSDDRMNFGF
jgi:hypothetical protein